jgi:hypothetical protein
MCETDRAGDWTDSYRRSSSETWVPRRTRSSFAGSSRTWLLKAMTTASHAAVGEARTGSLEMVAEGDAVFARFDYAITLPDGTDRTSRGLANYHLTDERIDVNHVMMMPDLHEVLGPLMGPPPTDQ